MSSSPEPRDVVVRQKRDDTKTVFLLGTRAAPNLFRFDTRDHAIAHAITFARTQRVRAWFENDETDFLPLDTFKAD
jgi:hypothetical protein